MEVPNPITMFNRKVSKFPLPLQQHLTLTQPNPKLVICDQYKAFSGHALLNMVTEFGTTVYRFAEGRTNCIHVKCR